MFSDILERCRELLPVARRDLEHLFRRHAHDDEPMYVSDREMFADLSRGDMTLQALQKTLRGHDDNATAAQYLKYLRQRVLPKFPYGPLVREEMSALLLSDHQAARKSVRWADQVCARSFFSPFHGTFSMGPYFDWYSDLAGKSWFFEHARGMREKIYHARLHDVLKMGPLRATWDLNALHHLVELGKAWWITNEERYAQQYVLQALDWMEKNPPNMGVNWMDELTVARRAVSWIFAFHIFVTSTAVTPDFAVRCVKMSLMHGAYLAEYLRGSRKERRAGYRLAAAAALHLIGSVYPEFHSCQRWRDMSETVLPATLEKEFGDNGGHRSGSVDLHRLCCEFALLPFIIAAPNATAVDPDTERRTVSAFQFLIQIQEPGGHYQPIGAAWPERVLCFGPPYQPDVAGLLGLAAVLLDREDLHRVSRPSWTIVWLAGMAGVNRYQQMGNVTAGPDKALSDKALFYPQADTVRFYPQAALVIMRDGWLDHDFWAAVRTVPSAPQEIAGRVHDDAMHVSIAVGNHRIFTDTGSLLTDDERGRYFDSPLAHNGLVIREADPVPISEIPRGASHASTKDQTCDSKGVSDHKEARGNASFRANGGTAGEVTHLDGGRVWIHAGSRAWRREGKIWWHCRDLIFDAAQRTLAICDAIDGDGAVDLEVSFHVPTDVEIVQRGDHGCIFWKRTGLFRMHPYFPDAFRGHIHRGTEDGLPALMTRDGLGFEPLQRLRYTARLNAPSWMIFWMTWDSDANTPGLEEVKSLFSQVKPRGMADLHPQVGAPGEGTNGRNRSRKPVGSND